MKMAHDFKHQLDDAVKSVASKEDIDSLKKKFWVQSDIIKELELEITNLERKVVQLKKPKQNLMETFPHWKLRWFICKHKIIQRRGS